MAYFIDETGKRGLKAEGKRFFAWDFEKRDFAAPVDDAPPKSRMRRCSVFEAKKFNFLSDETDWVDKIDSVSDENASITDRILPKLEDADMETLRVYQREAEEFSKVWLPAAKEAYEATVRYGVENSPVGEGARGVVKSIENMVEILELMIQAKDAGDSVEIRFVEK